MLAIKEIASNPKLFILLDPHFDNDVKTKLFIKECLKKITTRRSLLRLQWFSEIADGMEEIKGNRPALKLVFLMALAEGVATKRIGLSASREMGSQKVIHEFFKYISKADKTKLTYGIRRSLIGTRIHKLNFSSIIRILYQLRNDAVHGIDFWSFSLVNERSDKWGKIAMLTEGKLGTIKNKRRISLTVNLYYQELKDIFIRTAISNISAQL